MHYVYVLRSKKDGKFYTGCTKDLKERLALHNTGNIEATHLRKPFILIYYEAFLNKYDAFQREGWLKTGWGRNHITKLLQHYLKI